MRSRLQPGRSMTAGNARPLQYAFALIWLAFTVSLAGWWLIFGLRQADEIRRLDHAAAPQLEHVQRMLLWEGAVLIAALFGGGGALLYQVGRERQRQQAFEEFFAAFTHDLKTSLASLRLQVESLQEDLSCAAGNPLLTRLHKDSVRLQVQLDNSLFFTHMRRGELLIEPLPLSRVIETVRQDFPELTIALHSGGEVLADVRGLETIVRNIFQNAVTHGGADGIEIRDERSSVGTRRLVFKDNGKGTQANLRQLSKPFTRPAATSGAGVGLYICRQLLRRMRGNLHLLPSTDRGFAVAIDLPASPT
jgi:signal transduction histidine kinase